MSESSAESSQEQDQQTELVNMAAANQKRRGCCRRHPVACGVTLLVAVALSLAVLGVALGIRSYLNQTFLDTVHQVYTELVAGDIPSASSERGSYFSNFRCSI